MSPENPSRTEVAAFDLDGTLVRGDTFLLFLILSCGLGRGLWALLSAARYIGRPNEAKAAVIRIALRGRSKDEMTSRATTFAKSLARSPMIRSAVVARAHSYQAQGLDIAVVTSSLELYAVRIAEQLGFDDCIGTRLEVDEKGYLTGAILGENCRDEAKVERLRDAYQDLHIVAAYGDSDRDNAMLASASNGYRVSKWWKGRTSWFLCE